VNNLAEFDQKKKEKFPDGMSSYSFTPVVPEQISYAEATFKHFTIREVYINGKQKGEFHIKTDRNPSNLVILLRSHFIGCSIDLIDPSGLLNLEYPIYLICKGNPLILETVQQTFEKIDGEMNGKTLS
jgi:hypothetical protein